MTKYVLAWFSKNCKKYNFDFHLRILLSYKIFDPLSYFLIFIAEFVERYAFHVTFSRNKVIQLIINSRRTQNHFFLPTPILSCSFFAFEIRTALDACNNVNKVLSTNNKQKYLSYWQKANKRIDLRKYIWHIEYFI